MAVDITTTLNQITAMPVSDQIELLHEAWDRLIDAAWEPELTDAQKAEFDRRLDDLDANSQNVVSLEKLVEHVRRPRCGDFRTSSTIACCLTGST
jgi:putative addiction module component (TIGR02574 family)